MASSAVVVGIVNPKGGTGKTTLAVHLARALQRAGRSPVVIDTDPQESALRWSRKAPEGYDGPPVKGQTEPSTLRGDLEALTASYDVVVIDGAARLEGMTGAVVGASDAVLIPVQASGLDLWGTQEVMGVVERQVQSAGLRAAFVASRRDTRTRMAAQIGQALAERFDLPVFEGTAQRIAYARAMTQGRTALDGYDDKATAEISQLLEDIAQLLRTDRTCHE